MAVPAFLQSCLWSYDLSKLNKKQYKHLIITQIINYGDDKLSWLKKNYLPEEIKEVVSHPSRGVWSRDKLRFWLKTFNLTIDPLDFEVAIFDLNPRPKLMRAFFERIKNH